MSQQLLFVCTGNTCRSPLAEVMARKLLQLRGADVTVSSAGTSAWNGAPASDASILVGLERRLDLSTHRARALTRAIVDDASVILVMGVHHVEKVRALGGEGKVWLLTDYAANAPTGRPVGDPFGSGLDAYRQMADELESELPRAIARLLGERPLPEQP